MALFRLATAVLHGSQIRKIKDSMSHVTCHARGSLNFLLQFVFEVLGVGDRGSVLHSI